MFLVLFCPVLRFWFQDDLLIFAIFIHYHHYMNRWFGSPIILTLQIFRNGQCHYIFENWKWVLSIYYFPRSDKEAHFGASSMLRRTISYFMLCLAPKGSYFNLFSIIMMMFYMSFYCSSLATQSMNFSKRSINIDHINLNSSQILYI